MPTKILESDVCRRIVESRAEALARIVEIGATHVGYSRANFFEDMAGGDFIASRTTMTSKWEMLKADGVVSAARGSRTELDVRMLYLRAGIPMPRPSSHTHTHTSTEEIA